MPRSFSFFYNTNNDMKFFQIEILSTAKIIPRKITEI